MTRASKNKPLITIVVPIYKVEAYLDKCINSIIQQTYQQLEIILVDDGSPDNCGKICDDYAKKDNRIKVIHKENGGLSDARNAGIDIAKGQYITFIDSDDYVELDYVEQLYGALTEEAQMVIGGYRVIYENGTILNQFNHLKTTLTKEETLKRMLYDDGISVSACGKLYSLNLFKAVRYPKRRLFEDAATTYRLIDLCTKISINSVPLYNYMMRNDSISQRTFNTKKMDLIDSTKEMCDYIKSKYPNLTDACQRRMMYAYLSTLSQLAMSSQAFPKEEKQLVTYVKEHGVDQLKDGKTPLRDKIAIISLEINFKFYKWAWNLYRKLTGRK